MLAVSLALLAALGFASSAVFARLGLQRINPLVGVFLSLLASFTLTIILALTLNLKAVLSLPLIAFLWFLILGIINYPLARVLNFTSVSMIGASRTSPIVASAPLVSAILAIAFLGERPNGLIVLGTLGIIGGLALVVSERQSSASRNKN